MPRLTVVRPDEPTAIPAAPGVSGVSGPARVGATEVAAVDLAGPARVSAYAAAMQARCALARLIRHAGHREPPRHRAA